MSQECHTRPSFSERVYQVEEIESKVGKASYHTPWTLSEFEEYFYREFNFSSKDVHGKVRPVPYCKLCR